MKIFHPVWWFIFQIKFCFPIYKLFLWFISGMIQITHFDYIINCFFVVILIYFQSTHSDIVWMGIIYPVYTQYIDYIVYNIYGIIYRVYIIYTHEHLIHFNWYNIDREKIDKWLRFLSAINSVNDTVPWTLLQSVRIRGFKRVIIADRIQVVTIVSYMQNVSCQHFILKKYFFRWFCIIWWQIACRLWRS